MYTTYCFTAPSSLQSKHMFLSLFKWLHLIFLVPLELYRIPKAFARTHETINMLLLEQFFWSLLCIWLTAAAVASEGFIEPPPPDDSPDLGYIFGTTLLITWQTNLSSIALTLFHEPGTNIPFEYLRTLNNICVVRVMELLTSFISLHPQSHKHK